MRLLAHRRALGAAATLLGATLIALGQPAPAAAEDLYPCGAAEPISWSSEPVQPCPLGSPLGPNGWVPVYREPVPNPRGAAPPQPAGWLHGINGHYFVCERPFTSAVYYHPNGWRNYWWAYTLSDDGVWGWVPEVFFRGGVDDEPDGGFADVNRGLRGCPASLPAPDPGSPEDPPIDPPMEPDPRPLPPSVSVCDPQPRAAGRKVRARFGGGRATITTRYGKRPQVKGAVNGSDGQPLPGITLCVGAIDPGLGALRQVDTVTTDANGRFTYKLDRGSSRRVWFVHRAEGTAAVASVVVQVKARVRLRASRYALRNGQTVDFIGRLRGGTTARDVVVTLEARRGDRWQTFAITSANRQGRFSYRYRFSRTLGVQRYDLRARVVEQRGYPFATGASKPVRLTVTG